MLTLKCHEISELSVEYRFGAKLDKAISDKVLAHYNHLVSTVDFTALGINDVVPTYTTIAVHFTSASPLFHDPHYLDAIMQNAPDSSTCKSTQIFEIEVDYQGEDMDYVCHALGLSKESVIDLHANRAYSIAMLGFRPYFPYLLGLDERLHLPRRDNPRYRVKKGSVAIGMGQTGIYPEDSPGGWHIIGHTKFDDFDKLRPSNTIIFRALKENDVN